VGIRNAGEGQAMEVFFQWIKDNQILSGAGALVLSGIGVFIKKLLSAPENSHASANSANTITINNTNGLPLNTDMSHGASHVTGSCLRNGKIDKTLARILFVDDDTRFQVVKIMKGAGWPNVKIIKDVKDLSCPEVVEAHIIFVDIQGVGGALGFADEGLGLTLELKRKYSDKKIIIYSAQTTGDRFHKAINKADGSLSKNAEPYQFMSLVEELLERP